MENKVPSDIELMARLGRGDLAALGVLADRYQSRILSFSYRLLGDWHKAEDVSQETFLRLRQAAGRYEPKAKFTTWLYRIVHNLSLDQQRKAVNDPVSLEALHKRELVLRQYASDDVAVECVVRQLPPEFICRVGHVAQAHLGADGAGGGSAIAGDHDHAHRQCPEALNQRLRVWPRRVMEADEAQKVGRFLPSSGNADNAEPTGGQFIEAGR